MRILRGPRGPVTTYRSVWSKVLAVALGATLLVACTSSDDTDDDETETTDPVDTSAGDGAVDLCEYLPAEDLEALNPRGKEPVSTILLGDFTYLGCTVGDVYSISFGIRVIDDGDPYDNLHFAEPEDLDGFGDEAKVAYQEFGADPLASQTVAYFGDIVVYVRNDSIGNSDLDFRVEDERVYEAVTAFAEALPDDIVESALTAVVDTDVCPAVTSDVVTSLAGDVVLARGGHADAAERCAYRGDDGTQIRLSSRASDQPIDFELAGDPVTLPNVDGADGAIRDDGSVVELTVVSPGERLSFIAVFSGDGDGDVDADTVIELAEEFLGLVG